VIEWDKDDIDALKFMKVDCLALGMLSCMKRGFDLLKAHKGIDLDLASIPAEDPLTYAMIRRADTLGVFQIESRAQMAMLPRIKPRTFYDLVIEVAIVRPGPIQGEMVHPYLRRREGREPVEYPKPELEKVLGKTLGVPLFQEQAMRVAIECAGFTPGEADQLRRAMATFKMTGGVSSFHDKLVQGMVERGYPLEFAERTFSQLEGFGSYGFPESHAASFALIAYASSWLKCRHPDVFCAALLNAQPMGFYAPAQIVRDAREHGVEVRPVCVNASRWDCVLEETENPERFAVRLGLRMVRGLVNGEAAALVTARGDTPYASMDDVWRRSGAGQGALVRLAEADAFRPALGQSRREALWSLRGLNEEPLALFAAADAREAAHRPEVEEPEPALRPMTAGREVVEDYSRLGLTLREHPLAFLRQDLAAEGFATCRAAGESQDGRAIRLAGIVLVRQKPGSAKGVMFITIEDETGVANLVIWPTLYEKQRRVILTASMLGVVGRVQREGEVVHVVAYRLLDRSADLSWAGRRISPRTVSRSTRDPSPRRQSTRHLLSRFQHQSAAPEDPGFSLNITAGLDRLSVSAALGPLQSPGEAGLVLGEVDRLFECHADVGHSAPHDPADMRKRRPLVHEGEGLRQAAHIAHTQFCACGGAVENSGPAGRVLAGNKQNACQKNALADSDAAFVRGLARDQAPVFSCALR
jgi:error-prone DNA polymerase